MRYPPIDMDLATARIWDRWNPEWRELAKAPPVQRTPEKDAKLMAQLRPMMDAIDAFKATRPDPEE